MDASSEIISTYTRDLYPPLTEGLGALRAQAEKERIPIISRDSEAFLLGVVKIKKPARILEIGTAVGYSAACFAASAKGADIVTIDTDEAMCQKAGANLKKLRLDERVKILHGDAETVIKKSLSGWKFDLVFIDAAKSHYKSFFDASLGVCESGAVIISDNVLLKGTVSMPEENVNRRDRTSLRKMKAYIEYIMSLENADTFIIPAGDGMALTVLGGW